jgi:hypothetical protein
VAYVDSTTKRLVPMPGRVVGCSCNGRGGRVTKKVTLSISAHAEAEMESVTFFEAQE